MTYWIALIVAVSANVAANVMLKRAVNDDSVSVSFTGLGSVLTNTSFWAGVGFCGILFCAYVYAIRGVPLTIAYPTVTGLAMAGIAAVSILTLGEQFGASRMIGTILVMSGIVFLVQS